MPTVLKSGKYRFFFFSNEGSEECHIHVESGENYAKFWLEPIDLAKSVGYNNKELSEIRGIILHNVKHFKETWDAYFGFKKT
ncbi:DUF4160 domain-containing protein [Candidatus Bathyarchaeota archaeon]|nr:DUF4160 domain-containing protein [Candidatus Bathyarchaeota archaeon]